MKRVYWWIGLLLINAGITAYALAIEHQAMTWFGVALCAMTLGLALYDLYWTVRESRRSTREPGPTP